MLLSAFDTQLDCLRQIICLRNFCHRGMLYLMIKEEEFLEHPLVNREARVKERQRERCRHEKMIKAEVESKIQRGERKSQRQ